MKSIRYCTPSVVLITAMVLSNISACQKNTANGGTGNKVSIYLTDDPSLVFDNVFIDIRKLEIKVEDSSELEDEREHESEHGRDDANGDTKGGWMALSIQTGVYDVLKFRNGLDTLLSSTDFPNTKTLKKIRLTLGPNNSVTLNGTTFPLTIKDKDNIVVINLEELVSGDQLRWWLDFDASNSIRRHGNDFELKPQVKAFRKENAGSIEGRVLPADAMPLVFAINGTDTASAKPEREGEFKIVGLKAGTYAVWVHATANNYKDTLVQRVIVTGKEDTHLSAVTLHK